MRGVSSSTTARLPPESSASSCVTFSEPIGAYCRAIMIPFVPGRRVSVEEMIMLRFGIGLAAVALAAQAQTAGAWNTVSDKRGASLQVPAGWNAAADPNSTRINVSGPAGARMVVWPVFMAETLNGQ